MFFAVCFRRVLLEEFLDPLSLPGEASHPFAVGWIAEADRWNEVHTEATMHKECELRRIVD